MEHDAAYERARTRVEARLGFYRHLIVYLAVNTLLFILNLITSPHYLWFKWPLMGWGIGLFFHAVSLFFSGRMSEMKKRMIEKELAKETTKH